jgi:hypothetical protein
MKLLPIGSILLAGACAAAPAPGRAPLACSAIEVTGPTPDSALRPPRPRGFFLPPLPPPAAVRGQSLLARLVVDASGAAVPDSIAVCGIADAAYARELALRLARLTFEPARRDGVAVRAPVFIGYQF